jgi:acetyl esterase
MRLLSLILIVVTFFPACQRPPASSGTTTEAHEFTKTADVPWASPRGFDLTMDIYTPQTRKKQYPVIVMYHGGGWLINNKSIMDEGAAYLASHGEYVVCNVNYRLLGDLDNSVTMDEIVGDAFGALLWVQENIAEYGGDPDKIIVTGDSAGGHLATMVATQGHKLSETKTYGAPDYLFRPSYLPAAGLPDEGVTVAGAMISYGAFDHLGSAMSGFETPSNIFWALGQAQPRGIFGESYNHEEHPERYKMVSPLYLIESAADRDYPPMLFTVGSEDNLTTPASIEAYIDKLREAGHDDLEYWIHEGRPHAFLDSGSNEFLGIEFSRDAIPALDYMMAYLDKQF